MSGGTGKGPFWLKQLSRTCRKLQKGRNVIEEERRSREGARHLIVSPSVADAGNSHRDTVHGAETARPK
ncbi:hypothetical protein AAFF_G00072560 [Aldrovandia affinis]|uniref:Uncharacterized protein n=1 Tax=Aldrovandia affinis TaxID=143900 RepID=A0AAD7WD90_9TELE|nr:hypothetical protein AAFF_G00072560 [Aldrovandia affinis]